MCERVLGLKALASIAYSRQLAIVSNARCSGLIVSLWPASSIQHRVGSIFNSCEFAQIGSRHGLGAAPHQKEQGLAAPSAGRMSHDVS